MVSHKAMDKIGAVAQKALITLRPFSPASILYFLLSYTLRNIFSGSLKHIAENLASKLLSCNILELQSSEGLSLPWSPKSEKIASNIYFYPAQTSS